MHRNERINQRIGQLDDTPLMTRLNQWDISKSLRPTQCHTPASFFMGRLADIQKILTYLMQGCRLIHVSGERGIGKSEVVLKTVEYMRERHLYDQYIYVEFGSEDVTPSYCLSLISTSFGVTSVPTNDAAQQATERLIEQIRELWIGKQLLVVMDGVDEVWDTRRGFMTYLLQRLRQRVADIQVILTAEHSVCCMRLLLH